MRYVTLVGAVACAMFGAAFARAEWPVLKTYEGENLRRVKMPLGGIGTGTISLAGRGALVDWEIRSRPAKGFTPVSAVAPGFIVRTETPDGKVTARLMEGPVDTESYEAAEGSNGYNHGFPRFARCRFRAAYPLAQVELGDAAVPVAATLEAMNPLVPNDTEASGIPAALLRWRLENRTDGALTVSVCGFMVSPCGGTCVRGNLDAEGLTGVTLASADRTPADDTLGELAFGVASAAGEVSRTTVIGDTNWMVKFDPFWRAFVATGRVADVPSEEEGRGERPMAAVSVRLSLKPHETVRVPFAVAWRFPHRRAWTGIDQKQSGAFDAKLDVGNHYAQRFASARAAMEDLFGNLPRYEAETVRFVDGVLATKAPAVVKEAALFNLSTLRSATCFRTADGHFFGWEGSYDDRGSCYGSCTHVWGYEHALVDLWPDLAKDMTDLQYGPASAETGHMSFRIGLPLATKARSTIDAADGHLQCVIKAYENWRKTGDDVWMRGLYPKIRRSVEFCWIPGGWDADADGVMEGCQHNTMDVEYYGPNPQMQFWYLGALRAAEELAKAAGDADFAAECARKFAAGREKSDGILFNGEYYEHRQTPGDTHTFQLGPGCLVDQLVGQTFARLVGLGELGVGDHTRKAIASVWKYNRVDNASRNFCSQRGYMLGDEAGLLMASWPRGKIDCPFPYSEEAMTGFEYVAATEMVYAGMEKEAVETVRAVRARHDGARRNPYSEPECGHHYARSMASWGVHLAWSGFHYSAPERVMSFGAREGRWFWSNGSAWGTFARRGGTAELKVVEGSLDLAELRVDGCAEPVARAVKLGSGERRIFK